MSKGVRAVVAVAAAVAVPFVAPAIASTIGLSAAINASLGYAATATTGLTAGGALVGGVLGAGVAAATRQNPLLGAVGGAIGGGIGGYNNYGSYLTGATPAAGGPGTITYTGAGVGAPAGVAEGFTPRVVGAPPPTPPQGFFAGIGEAARKELGGSPIRTVLSAGQLAYTLYNKPPEQLLPHEQQQVSEMAQLAQTNRGLFDQRLAEAQSLIRMGTAKPEEAFGQAQSTVQRGVAESTRGRPAGLRTAATRAGTIEATRQGTLAAARDAETAAKTRAAGVALLPTSAPATQSMMTAPIYEGQERRNYEYSKDLAQAIGGFAGSFSGPRTERVIEYRPYDPNNPNNLNNPNNRTA